LFQQKTLQELRGDESSTIAHSMTACFVNYSQQQKAAAATAAAAAKTSIILLAVC